MKKTTIISAALALALCSCGTGNNQPQEQNQSKLEQPDTEVVEGGGFVRFRRPRIG